MYKRWMNTSPPSWVSQMSNLPPSSDKARSCVPKTSNDVTGSSKGFKDATTFLFNETNMARGPREQRTSFPRMYFLTTVPVAAHTAFPSKARLVIASGVCEPTPEPPDQPKRRTNNLRGTYLPTKSNVIFPPSHNAQEFPRQVRM